MLARLARVLLVVALLAGWQAALVHPLQHLDEHGSLVHLDGKGSKPSAKSELCDALAALTACAPEAKLAFAAPSAGEQGRPSTATEWRAAIAPPFFSHGPPTLL